MIVKQNTRYRLEINIKRETIRNNCNEERIGIQVKRAVQLRLRRLVGEISFEVKRTDHENRSDMFVRNVCLLSAARASSSMQHESIQSDVT
jgi:hypothetical protein